LSCVFPSTHGKKIVCRAFFFLAHGKHFFLTGCYPCSQPLACALSLSCTRTRRTTICRAP
jgi:hypothetical protein